MYIKRVQKTFPLLGLYGLLIHTLQCWHAWHKCLGMAEYRMAVSNKMIKESHHDHHSCECSILYVSDESGLMSSYSNSLIIMNYIKVVLMFADCIT